MQRMYEIKGIIKEMKLKNATATDVPIALIYPDNRELDKETMRYYHRKYDQSQKDNCPYVNSYIQEAFTTEELLEIKNSGYLNHLESYEVKELEVVGRDSDLRMEHLIGLTEEQAKRVAYSQLNVGVSGIMPLGFGSGEDIILYKDMMSFPLGVYYNLHEAKAIK